MGGAGVIDNFLGTFTRYIDSGFGLLSGEVAFVATTLIVIDVTLAALFWSWSADDDIIARLVKKTLFVGVFAYLIGNWNNLAKIVFDSFAGLGLKASGTGFTAQDLMRPGKVAQTGLDAARPLLDSISDLMGWVAFFENFIQIACLLFAWALVILAFFILAIQLFVTLIEFKLSTLAGFVLIPFGLFGKTAFMAERVLGNVISSGIKVLVLAVIVGIGSTLFSQFTQGFGGQTPSIDDAMAVDRDSDHRDSAAARCRPAQIQSARNLRQRNFVVAGVEPMRAITHTPAVAAVLLSATMLAGCATYKPPQISYDADVPPLPAIPAAVTDDRPRPVHIPPAWAVARGGQTASTATGRVENANAAARVQPRREGYYNAIQIYPWSEGALYQVYAAPGQITDIALEPGESLTGAGPIAAGDTARWIIGDTESGSGVTRRVHILVKPRVASPERVSRANRVTP